MTCLPHRLAPSLALLLTTALVLPACVDPKSIGQETDGEDSGTGDTDATETTNGMTTQAPTTGETEGSSTAPTTNDTVVDTGVDCPPIDPGPCMECECTFGGWDCYFAGCVESCEGAMCGEACALCPDDDPECEFPLDVGSCTADGMCVGTPPPKLGFCEGALVPGFEGDLTEVSGCADVVVYAHDAADERGLVVSVDQGLAADAIAQDMPTHIELPATDPTVSIQGRAGFDVTVNECNDVIVPDDIKETWSPTAGTVIVDVTPDGMGGATATVQLVDVSLHRDQPGPAQIVVNFIFTDVPVAWLPG
ncbi:hypothetical protein [Paraliomyxa miuraensis]|uniref:hypothetical protein n=1 Tax=Paraliomyxa miuraensis TaxID=376150 RepID=UPI0022502CFD|nr:hypothetical protein [Paraliomyxa miuraensis]MCX4240645.1 hypothetical protein [Paraliomyxa miuraensis]